MKKLILGLSLLTSLSAFAEKITVDIHTEVNIPICRRVEMVGTWDNETEYRIEVLEVTRSGSLIKKLGESRFENHINRTLDLKNKTIDSNSRIKVDVYEEDWGVYGYDDLYPLAEVDIENYVSTIRIAKKMYDTKIYYGSLTTMDCLNIDIRETPKSIVNRNEK